MQRRRAVDFGGATRSGSPPQESKLTIVLPTRNEGFGFFGTIRHHAGSPTAWALAFTSIADATHSTAAAVRRFLDSRQGRQFAEDVAARLLSDDELARAIANAVESWMASAIDQRTAEETGIPEGLPSLTGFVLAQQFLLETPALAEAP